MKRPPQSPSFFISCIATFCSLAAFLLASFSASGLYAVTLPGDGNPYVISADTGDAFTLNSGWQIATDGNSRTVSGDVTFNADGSINVPGNLLTFSGSLGGGYGFTKTGDGMLMLIRPYNLGAASGQDTTIQSNDGILAMWDLQVGTATGATGSLVFSGDAEVAITRQTLRYYALALATATGATGNLTVEGNADVTVSSTYTNDGTQGFFLGQSGTGNYTQTGGTFTLQSDNDQASQIFMACTDGSVGTMNISGGSFNLAPSSGIHAGWAAAATVSFSGNAEINVGQIIAGDNAAAASGVVTLADKATVNITQDYLIVGRYGTGTFNMTGGELNIQGGGNSQVYISNFGGTGNYNASGGVANIKGNMYVGERGQGRLTVSGDAEINLGGQLNIATGHANTARGLVYQTGGTITADGGIVFNTAGNAATGAYYLAGGTLNTSTIYKPAHGTHKFVMTGGTLNAENIQMDITQYGGTLSPGGTGELGTTTINSSYTMSENPTPGVSHANVAFCGLAKQSSTGASRAASNAFDGVKGTDASSHTSDNNGVYGDYQWLQVDLGDTYEIAEARIYYRNGFQGPAGNNRLTNSGYYFEVADDEASFGATNALSKTDVWTSDVYTTYAFDTDYIRDLTSASGRYLRFARDFADYDISLGGGGDKKTINMSELEVYVVEDIVPNILHIDITKDGDFDELLFGAGGSLAVGDNVLLELGFVGDGAAGDFQVFDVASLSSILAPNGFTDVVMATHGWEVTDFSDLLSTGFVSIGSSAATPEPATWLMLLLGAVGLGMVRKITSAKR